MNYGSNHRLITIIVSLMLLGGCGGGTSGTGGLSINGNLSGSQLRSLRASAPSANDNFPLEGVLVTLEETGETDITDSSGSFTVLAPPVALSSQITLKFNGSNFESSYNIKNIPATASEVKLQLHLNSETEEVEGDSEDFKDQDGNEVEREEEAAEKE